MKTPLTKKTLRQHLTYSWWKYVLAFVLIIFCVTFYYDISSYRSPENKKVELYIYGVADDESLRAYMEEVRLSRMSDQEVIEPMVLTTDSAYGPMQLTTYMAAGEGDLYALPKDNFVGLAGDGAFLPLEEDEELMSLLSDAGITLQSGWRRNRNTGETHLYGIPLNKLPGLSRLMYVENGYLSVSAMNKNDENVFRFLCILVGDMLTAPEPDEIPPETDIP